METEEKKKDEVAPPVLSCSPEIAELAVALAKAQSEMTPAKKTARNPFFKSNYADLTSILESVRGPLTSNGIALIQGPSAFGSRVTVVTRLIHSSGQWVECSTTAFAEKNTPQAIGSVLTYLRRYGLSSMVGVATEDDDGESGMARKQKPGETTNVKN